MVPGPHGRAERPAAAGFASHEQGNPTTGTFDWLWSTVTDRIYGTGQTSLGNAGTLSSTSNSISAIDDRRPFIKITYLSGVALDGVLSQFTSPTTLCPGTGDVAVRFANVDCVVFFSVKVPSSVEILGAKTQNFYHGIQYIFRYIFLVKQYEQIPQSFLVISSK